MATLGLFGGNPFATPVGQRIEQATDAALASEDWGLNMEICDIINETEDGAKDAVKALRKRFSTSSGKNHTVILYTLTVLETCVKNCSHRFHLLACQKDFIQELVKIIQPKNDPPQVVQEKVLTLIQTWADAFRNQPDLKGVVEVYTELKTKGIEFPMTNLDTLSPIHTPGSVQRETEHKPIQQSRPSNPSSRQSVQTHRSAQPVAAVPPQQSMGPVNLTPEQLAKMRSELDTVCGNIRVFSEMLAEMQPGRSDQSDLELLHELNRTCRSMQTRIVELVSNVANEEVTEELLRVNDDLNNVFLRYDRFERYRTGKAGQNPNEKSTAQPTAMVQPPSYTTATSVPAPPPTRVSEPSLIDLSDDPGTSPNDIHVQLAGLDLGNSNVSSTLNSMPSQESSTGSKDEFDMFAQSRKVTYEGCKNSGSTYSDNTHIDQHAGGLAATVMRKGAPEDNNVPEDTPTDKPSEYDEMESWLKENKPEGQETMTSSEFDQFLQERAAAADGLPDLPNPPTGNPTPAGQPRRQLQKDEVENAMFAL